MFQLKDNLQKSVMLIILLVDYSNVNGLYSSAQTNVNNFMDIQR